MNNPANPLKISNSLLELARPYLYRREGRYSLRVRVKGSKDTCTIALKTTNRHTALATLVLSRLIHANLRDTDGGLLRTGRLPGNRFGSHAMEAWGYRLGEMKGEYTTDFKAECLADGTTYTPGLEWKHWSKTMQDYCVQDVVAASTGWSVSGTS